MTFLVKELLEKQTGSKSSWKYFSLLSATTADASEMGKIL